MSGLISTEEQLFEGFPVRYRLVDPYRDNGEPTLEYWYVVKKTPTGAWVAQAWSLSRHTKSVEWPAKLRCAQTSLEWMHLGRDELVRRGAKFVLDGDGKRYAHETIEWARYSYKKRKQWQIRYAQRSMDRAKNALHWLDTGRSVAEEEHLAMERILREARLPDAIHVER